MAHAPSTKTRRIRPDEELNLVPMIDMVTNLMFFLLMFASVLPVVSLDAPLPKIASTAEEVKKATNQENKLEILVNITSRGFQVVTDFAGTRSIPVGSDGKLPFQELHAHLITLQQKRPSIKEITLQPSDDVLYEDFVAAMDATRELLPGDPGYQQLPPDVANRPEESRKFNRLFPDVSIGGV